MIALFGAHESPADERDWALGKFGSSPLATLPTKADYSRFVENIYQQDGSSCCGWGTTSGWHVRARIQGDMAVSYPSALLNYTLGRCALQGDTEPLLDDGCWPRLTLLAAKQLGMVPLDKWRGLEKQNTRPDWGTLREAADRRAVSFARVYGVEELTLALAMGHPCVVAFAVDDSFVQYRDGIWDGMKGGPSSGHCTSIVGYNFDGGEDYFIGVNSWDYDWGLEGMYRISKRCIPTLPRFEAWAIELVNAEAA